MEKNLTLQRLEIAEEFADNHEHFDGSFVRSLREQYERRGSLSHKQEVALKNTFDKWNMAEWWADEFGGDPLKEHEE